MKRILLFAISIFLISVANAQYLRGDFNAWGTEYLMTQYYSYYTATLDVTVDVTDGAFKVDQTGDWSLQWGYATDSYNPIVNTSEGQMRGSNSGDTPSDFLKTLSAGKVYTFRLEGIETWWNRKFVIMETDDFPVDLLTVTDNNATVGTGNVTVNVETSAALSPQETVYLRYTNDSWVTSDIIACTGSGTTYTAEIPGMTAGTDVEYYVFSSAMVLSFVSTYPDFATLKGNNNAGANYTYTATTLVPYLVASVTANLEENTLDNSVIDLEIFNETFEDATFSTSNFTLNNALAGLSVFSVTYVDSENISIVLDFDGTDYENDITNFSITISADELTGIDPVTCNNLTIFAFHPTEGIQSAKIVFWEGGASDVYFDDTDFDGHDFGIMNVDSSLYLKSAQVFTWKRTGGDVLSATFNYRVYKQGDLPGAFLQQNLSWHSESVSNDTTYQLWWNDSPDEIDLNLLLEITEGTYIIETYYEIETASETLYRNNLGANYLAEYTWEEMPVLNASTQLELNSSNMNGAQIDLDLLFDTFIDDSPELGSYSLVNAPAGLTITEAIFIDQVHVKLTLSYSGGLIYSQVDNMYVSVAASEFASGQSLNSSEITVYADFITDGIYLSKISMWEGETDDVWYEEADFNGQDFGTFNSSMSLYFKSGQVFTWKNEFGNIVSATMNYRIYKDGDTPGAFVQQDLPFFSEWASGSNTDQLWWNDSPDLTDLNLLDGATPGEYIIEVYFEAENGVGLTHYSNNGGQNYKASFIYTDSPVLVATPSSAITEENLNGMIITLDLNDDTFANAILDQGNFSLNFVPAGVSIGSVTYVGPTQATLSLNFDGTDFDSDSVNFTISIDGVEITTDIDLTSNKMVITSVDETATIYTHLLTAENFVRYQGDDQLLWINMEIGQAEWNGAQIGIGTVSANPASFTWYNAEWYEDGEEPNKRVHSQITLPQEIGTMYYAGRVRNTEMGQWFYANNSFWSDLSVMNAEYEITTLAVPAPISVTTEMLDGTRINLNWQTPGGFDNIFVLAKATDAITSDPIQGTPYAMGTVIDGSTVIYKGNSEGFIHTGLQNNTTYNYKVYTLNNNYYSAGISASETTDDSEGCTFVVDLGDDINICGGSSVVLNSGLSTAPYGDSLTIIFNSSAYMDFAEVTKVYMHSGVEITAGTQWDYVVGNWGEDDGIGLMTDLGGGMWMMKFNPLEYYGYNAETNILGISVVFRNEDGTIIAQNPIIEGDFYIDMSVNPPVPNHNSVIALLQTSDIASILWSTGAQTPSVSISTNSEVWVSAMDIYGCVGSDTVNVGLHSLPYVELGLDQTVCSDFEVVLDAGTFAEYIWNNDAVTQTLTVTESGMYRVTVTDVNGCTGFDVVNVNLVDYPLADFSYDVISGTQVDFTDLSLNGVSYAWDFNNDNVTDNTSAGNVSFTYPAMGQYSVKLTVTNACSTDVETKTIYVLSVEDSEIIGTDVYPIPAADFLFVENSDSRIISVSVYDATGKQIEHISNTSDQRIVIDVENYNSGLYSLIIETSTNIETKKILIK